MNNSFRDLIEETMNLDRQFPIRYSTQDHFMDMVEEVGELSQAMQISSGRKVTAVVQKQRTQEDVVDGLCDVLFELIRLAEKLGVKLDQEYPKVLQQIKERVEKGEFKQSE